MSSLLPILSQADLRALFRNDERAIWRYHVLAALLHDGRSVREVAEAFGISAETIRILRAAFLENGHLDELRSKRRGAAGHLKRQTPLAQAVGGVLAAHPTASAALVWRRVQAELGAQGLHVARRSVYRLVDRLRQQEPAADDEAPGSELWAPALVPTLRAVLPLLALDSPADLGYSNLATQVLPDEENAVARGRLLREMLLEALAELKPPSDDRDDAASRSYLILHGEALRGMQREELQTELAIATATYTRAKRQGLERLAELLVGKLARYAAPTTRTEPPPVPGLLGREGDVRYYTRRLADDGIAVVWGLPGSGKTALAATLAREAQAAGQSVVWHACRGAGDAIPERVLHSLGVAHVPRNVDPTELLSELRAALKMCDLLVLDVYDSIADDPITTSMMALLRSLVAAGSLRLLVVTRVLPVWADGGGWQALGGLTHEGARALWTIFGGQALTAEVWQALYFRTLGYPGLLHMLASDLDAPLAPLIREQVDVDLPPSAIQMLDEALLARCPLRCETTGLPAASTDRSQSCMLLQRRGLFVSSLSGTEVHLHALLQTHRFALQSLVSDNTALNRRLAEGAAAEGRWLDAAAHVAAAGDSAHASALLGANLPALIEQQQAGQTIELLRELLQHGQRGPALATITAQLGVLYLAMGQLGSAGDAFENALAISAASQDLIPLGGVRQWHYLAAETYLQSGQWRRALAHVQTIMSSERGADTSVSPEERITLTLMHQRVWVQAGQADQARFWLADAQMQLRVRSDPTSSALVAAAEGVDAAQRGALRLAVQRFHAALDDLSASTHLYLCADTRASLARCLAMLGRPKTALALLEKWLADARGRDHRLAPAMLALALVDVLVMDDDFSILQSGSGNSDGPSERAWRALRQAEEIGDLASVRVRAELHLARGSLLMLSGSTSGMQHFAKALALTSDPPLPEIQVRAQLRVASILLQQGDTTTAAQLTSRAARQAGSAGLERYRNWANIYLAYEALSRHAYVEVRALLDAIHTTSDRRLQAAHRHLAEELNAVPSAIPSPKL